MASVFLLLSLVLNHAGICFLRHGEPSQTYSLYGPAGTIRARLGTPGAEWAFLGAKAPWVRIVWNIR